MPTRHTQRAPTACGSSRAPFTSGGLGQPRRQRLMHRLYSDNRLLRVAPFCGEDGEGPGLRTAQAAVRAHELLEWSHLPGVRVIHAVDEDVRAVGKPVVA